MSTLAYQLQTNIDRTGKVFLGDYTPKYTRQGIKQAISKLGYKHTEITAQHQVVGWIIIGLKDEAN